MVTFRKQEGCPASQDLLAYQLGDLGSTQSRVIGKHLIACEFCTSEVQFYEHYPPSVESDDTAGSDAAIPTPLRQLAEALLNRERASGSMDEILRDVELAARKR
jgi:hypothetical protein